MANYKLVEKPSHCWLVEAWRVGADFKLHPLIHTFNSRKNTTTCGGRSERENRLEASHYGFGKARISRQIAAGRWQLNGTLGLNLYSHTISEQPNEKGSVLLSLE